MKFRIPSSSCLISQSRSSAFTLVELLVSMTILSGLIVLLFSVVDNTTKVWNKSEQRVDAFREARAALFVIAHDLQSMVPAPDIVNETLTATDPKYYTPNGIADFNYLFINPPIGGTTDVTCASIATAAESDSIFFLTAQPSSAQSSGAKSDVCSVGYYLDYVDAPLEATGAPSVFKLFRTYQNSDATFAKLKTYAGAPSGVLIAADSTRDEVLARNVIDFRVKAYDTSMTQIVPWDKKTTPYAVDLSISAYNYSAAQNFFNRGDWMDFTTKKNASQRQTFSTRVYLPLRGPTPTPVP